MGGEGLTDRRGKSEQWADKWGAMVPGVWEGEGSPAVKCTDKLPVPAALGAGRYRAGPDPAGSPRGGEGGGGATPTGPKLPAPQVPAPAAGSRGARIQGRLGPRRSQAGSEHHPSTHVPSRYPEVSLSLGLLSPCLSGSRSTLGRGNKRGLIHTSLALGTQLLLPLQVIHTYLQQTGNYRCPTLQHVWKVNREGEVRQSPPPVTSLPCHHPHS